MASAASEVISLFLNNTEETNPFLEDCSDAKTPFSLMYIGSFVSCFITIMFVHANTFGKTGKLIFWIFMFMLFMMQLYGDALDLSDAIATFSEGTDVFNCYARIVVNSANFKWSVCSTLCSLSSEAFQNPEKSSKIKFSDAFNRKKLIKRLYKDPVSEIFLICPFLITSLMTFPIFFSHVVWGQIEYCWFTMLIWMCSDLCISCGRCCCRPKSKLDPDGNPVKKTKFQFVLTVVFLLWQLGCYSMVYYIGTVIPVNFVSLHGFPMSANYTMSYENATAYLEAVIQTWESRSLADYNDEMIFGENVTMATRAEYFWVIV
jgi:hypothetical protein